MPWTRKRMLWTIAITAVATLLVVVLSFNFATPEKKLERKIEHRYAVSDPQFRREMGVLLGPAILPGNRVTDLENGDRIFPAMLEAIRGARRTITFETYIYWDGKVGQEFADALSERARAGVAVNVFLLVRFGSELRVLVPAGMKEEQVSLFHFDPLLDHPRGVDPELVHHV